MMDVFNRRNILSVSVSQIYPAGDISGREISYISMNNISLCSFGKSENHPD
jgi:hypothetical protein